jgi:hypothetical protein
MIAAISSNVAQYVTVDRFARALRTLVVEEMTPALLEQARQLSRTTPFPYSRPTCAASKTVFNLVRCDNEFERRFAMFLQDAPDVEHFAKLPSQFGFTIEYTDAANNLRYYEPDFVAVLDNGTHYLVETKGREDVDVAHKDRAARIRCENATMPTGTCWDWFPRPRSTACSPPSSQMPSSSPQRRRTGSPAACFEPTPRPAYGRGVGRGGSRAWGVGRCLASPSSRPGGARHRKEPLPPCRQTST